MKRLFITIVVLLVLGACVNGDPQVDAPPIDLADADLIGTWHDKAEDMITFAEDGTFDATNLPYTALPNFPGVLPPNFRKGIDKLPATGTWRLTSAIGSKNGKRRRISLSVDTLADQPSTTSTEMRAEWENKTIVLTFYIGDPDLKNRIVYRKGPRLPG